MQVEGGQLQSALQYQVLSTGLHHGHLLVVVTGVQRQQYCMLPLEKRVWYTYINITIRTTAYVHIVQLNVWPEE